MGVVFSSFLSLTFFYSIQKFEPHNPLFLVETGCYAILGASSAVAATPVLLFVLFSIYLNGNFAGIAMRQLII